MGFENWGFGDCMAIKRLELDPSAVRADFESKLPDVRWSGRQGTARCPFHPDRKASLSLDAEKGLYFCHACGAKGNLEQFERKLSGSERKTAKNRIAKLAHRGGGRTCDQESSLFIHTKMKTEYCVTNKFGSSQKISGSADQMGMVAGFGICKACR